MISDKKLAKVHKVLGLEIVNELNSTDTLGLQNVIVQAEVAISDAQEELEANLKYQQLKESLKDLSQGLKDVRKFQRAKIDLAISLLETRGK